MRLAIGLVSKESLPTIQRAEKRPGRGLQCDDGQTATIASQPTAYPTAAERLSSTDEIVPPPALIRAGLETLPSIIRAQGERASRRFIEFFTANMRNRNTRIAYAHAVKKFFDWCESRRLELEEIEPLSVAAYIEQLGVQVSKPTVKQHLAAIRKLFDYLTTGRVLDSNPATSVRGPKYVARRGKTPVLGHEARKLLGINRDHHVDRPARSGADWSYGL